MRSEAKTVERYLADLPADRRAAISALREVILKNLPRGYEEGMAYGMIGYHVPHSVYPPGYHCDPRQPLPFAALASQKNHMALYLMCMYSEPEFEKWFRGAWAERGKRLDMGKSCVRFKKLEDVPLDVIGAAIKKVPAKRFIEYYERAIKPPEGAGKRPAEGRKATAKKAAASDKAPARKKASPKK